MVTELEPESLGSPSSSPDSVLGLRCLHATHLREKHLWLHVFSFLIHSKDRWGDNPNLCHSSSEPSAGPHPGSRIIESAHKPHRDVRGQNFSEERAERGSSGAVYPRTWGWRHSARAPTGALVPGHTHKHHCPTEWNLQEANPWSPGSRCTRLPYTSELPQLGVQKSFCASVSLSVK